MTSLSEALSTFDAVEANLARAEEAWRKVQERVPTGIVFGNDIEYVRACDALSRLMSSLPPIHGWRPSKTPMDLDDIAQGRLDADEIGEPDVLISLGRRMEEPGEE